MHVNDNVNPCPYRFQYLKGKEAVRTREFGRNRWNDCMSFLAQVMPRDKFEDYCREVNEKRGVRAGHKDHVSPESFYPAGTTIKDAISETQERIARGGGTERDFARLIACEGILDDHDDIADEAACGTPEEKRRLCSATEAVLGDPRFEKIHVQHDKGGEAEHGQGFRDPARSLVLLPGIQSAQEGRGTQ
jgi:hypothetical protein